MADAAEVYSTPLGYTPNPSLAHHLSIAEEGKAGPSQESTENIISPTANAHKVIAELVGTYVIVFVGCGSIVVDRKNRITFVGVAVTWGLAVMMTIYTLGHVSGGHFNPAVTIAFACSGKFPWRQVPAFVASQVAGSVLAICTLVAMFHQGTNVRCTVTQFPSPTNELEAFAWEFIISFNLMLTICGVATDNRAINELSGLTVGAMVLINFIVAGKITGASMNPARSIGPALVFMDFQSLWIYIAAPTLGTLTACMIYSFFRIPTQER